VDALSGEQKQVAHAWALWVAEHIVDDLMGEGLIVESDVEAARDLVVMHLEDVVISNAVLRVGEEGGR
jgi:hypothetical protein